MAAAERDSTLEWVLPEAARPPSVRELEARIEEALATARASEAAAMTVGAAALDAAAQARRAAELAERAATSAADAAGGPRGPGLSPISGARGTAVPKRPGGSLGDFDAQADQLMERLRQLQRVPLGRASSAAAPTRAAH